jgi:glycine/D-amino acid oxidase-like deaminating enzyme
MSSPVSDEEFRSAPYLPISPWVEQPTDLQPSVETDTRSDVAVIGGGLTGLSTALELRRRGIDVAVVEAEFAGFGASGRNAGHLTPTIGKDLPTLLKLFGKEKATRLIGFAERGVERVERLISELGIECDYRRSGNIMAAIHPEQEKRLRAATEAAAAIGAHVRFLDRDAMRTRGVPPAFIAGAIEERGGTFHPGKYVMGLRRAALQAGVRLFEKTPVTAIEPGAKPRIRTARGIVSADRVVLATNAYTPELGLLRSRIVPMYDTMFESEPLSGQQLEALGWPGREGVYTAHESLESFRLSAQGTILGGSKCVRYSYGGRIKGASTPRAIWEQNRMFRERFPMLSDVRIQHFWGGWIAITLHFIPTVGALDKRRSVIYGMGYNGHGVAAATAMGCVLADLVQGQKNEDGDTLSGFVPPLPPEPLRMIAVGLVSGFLDRRDHRIDRAVRAALRADSPG